MTPEISTIAAYGVITLLLWGYAAHLVLAYWRVARPQANAHGKHTK